MNYALHDEIRYGHLTGMTAVGRTPSKAGKATVRTLNWNDNHGQHGGVTVRRAHCDVTTVGGVNTGVIRDSHWHDA